MKKILSFSALLLVGFILFLPKSNLYYSAENALASAHLYLNNEKINERFFYLDIREATLLLDTMPIGSIEQIKCIPLILFNRVTVSGIEFSGEFASLFPQGIDYLNFTYTLIDPLTVTIKGEGGFGPVEGEIDMGERKLILLFNPSPILRTYPLLLSKLHTSNEGLVYETSF
jgi:hypothetical protein